MLFASGLIVLQEPLRQPVFTKFALGARTLPSEVPRFPKGEGGEVVDVDMQTFDFLLPHLPWDQVIVGATGWFPERSGPHYLPDFQSPIELVQAVKDGAGVCSDWTESLMVMCRSTGRICREWADIPLPGSGSIGHSVVEFWAPDLHKWVLIDVFLGFWARDADTGDPLSALEAEDFFLGSRERVEVVPLPGRTVDHLEVESYYADPQSRLVLMANNDPIALAAHWSRRIEMMSKPLGQLVQRLTGVAPRYLITPTIGETPVGRALSRFRFMAILGICFTTLGVLGLAACLSLGVFRGLRA